jgi:hypothetical protein
MFIVRATFLNTKTLWDILWVDCRRLFNVVILIVLSYFRI